MKKIIKAVLLLGLVCAACPAATVYQAIHRGSNATANSLYYFDIDLTALGAYPTLFLHAQTFQYAGGQMLDAVTDPGGGIDSQIWLFNGSLGNLLATSFVTSNDDINTGAMLWDSQLLNQPAVGGNQYLLALTLFNKDFLGGPGSPITAGFNSGGQAGSVGDGHYAVQVWATTEAIPEPATYALMSFGLGGMMILSRRRRA